MEADVFDSSYAGPFASVPLTRNVSLARGSDRRNTSEHLLKEEELLMELSMRPNEVNQHR